MAETHVLTALVDKYRRLSGELAQLAKKGDAIRNDLLHLEAAIRIFKADFTADEITCIKPYTPNLLFRKGELTRMASDILRTADRPQTSWELVVLALQRKGIAEPEERIMCQLRNTLNGCLTRRLKKGLIAVQDDGFQKRWSIHGGRR